MQTFLPYPDFRLSAECLDWCRLGKQRVEAFQILSAISNPNYGWQNHPVVRMWKGYDVALILYMNEMIFEWISRGYNNTMKIVEVKHNVDFPPWLGDERLHSSHRSNLLRKYLAHYGRLGWVENNSLPYFWPV